MLMANQPNDASGLIVCQPGIDRIRVTRPQQALPGNRVGTRAGGNLQQGSTAFTDIGPWIMIAMLQQLVALGIGQT